MATKQLAVLLLEASSPVAALQGDRSRTAVLHIPGLPMVIQHPHVATEARLTLGGRRHGARDEVVARVRVHEAVHDEDEEQGQHDGDVEVPRGREEDREEHEAPGPLVLEDGVGDRPDVLHEEARACVQEEHDDPRDVRARVQHGHRFRYACAELSQHLYISVCER
jgi:hypothetical protein